MDTYQTIKSSGYGEVVEKKSRFLGELHHISTEEEAEALIAAAKKKYYDARHHCFAYVVGEPGSVTEIQRYSDDGEPQGSAGRPMLEVLVGEKLHECLVIVTRYFGGTLLGTGGLVRAYSQAAKEALQAAERLERKKGELLAVRCSYTDAGKLEYLFAEAGLPKAEADYTENVLLFVKVPLAGIPKILSQITERTDGRAAVESRTPIVFEQERAVLN